MTDRVVIRRSVPDLARWNFSFDLGGISLVEGLRAAMSTAALVAASEWLHEPGLVMSALASLFACLSDIGGPIRRRVPALLSYSVLGAILIGTGGLVREAGIPVALPYSAVLIFCCTFARIYGQQAQQVGMFLAVLVVLSLDHPFADFKTALTLSGFFLAGGLWATLLTLALWRIHPFQPARRALAKAYAALAEMTRDLLVLLRQGEPETAIWERHARAHRGQVRAEIEAARTVIVETLRARGPASLRAAQSLLRLETADQMFGALIAMSELLETADESERKVAAHMIRRLRPLLAVLGHEILADQSTAHLQIGRSIEAMARDIAILPPGHRLRELAGLIVARLRVVMTVSASADSWSDAGPGPYSPRMWQALRTPLLANLDWQSLAFRHALRAAVITVPAIAFTFLHGSPFDHWLSITILVTMQPYFGLTFMRALERVAGTTLGGLLAATLGLFVTTGGQSAVAIFPLALLAFTMRAVSFGLFVSLLTPMIVLLVELGVPDTSDWVIAGERVMLTLLGGVSAILACYLLWPSWEPNRLPDDVRAAIAAHGRYAEAELSLILGEVDQAAVERTRRAAGLATNNVEAAVARALLEPRHRHDDRLEAAMVIDAALRRVAGRLAAMQFDPRPGCRTWQADNRACRRIPNWKTERTRRRWAGLPARSN
jgi:uncharacterized membrane protein YccC